jgi:hypothetical protein
MIDAPAIWLPPKPAIIRPATRDILDFGSPLLALGGAAAAQLSSYPGSIPYSFAQTATDTTPADTNTPNFGSLSIGAADANRLVFCSIAFADPASVGADISAFDILINGGTPTYVRSGASGSGSARGNIIAGTAVPTGTTATFTVSLTGSSAAIDDWAIAVFRVTGVSLTPIAAVNSGSIDTTGAKFVLISTAHASDAPGAYTGGGSATLSTSKDGAGVGYDSAPTGSASSYSATNPPQRTVCVAFG